MGRPRKFTPERVVAQAMETFWSNGYAGTSPAALAEATGLGKGSLYNTFGSKRDLFDQALDLYGRAGAEMTEDYLSRPGTAKERIRAYLEFLVDVDLDGPERRGCLAVNTAIELSGHDRPAARTVRQLQQKTVALLADRIRQGVRDGDVAKDIDPTSYARFLMNTITGLRVMARTSDRKELGDIIDTALSGM